MQKLLAFINRFRGFFLGFSTLIMRWIFILSTFGLMVLGADLDPKIEHIFRTPWENRLKGPNREVIDIDFRSDGQWLAGASKDGNIYIWDFNNFENLNEEQRKPIELPLGEGYATQVAFCPGGFLVSAGTNEEVRVWLTNTLRQGSVAAYQAHTMDLDSDDPFLNSYTLDKHTSVVDKLILSPNERWLASADVSGTVVLWNTGLLGFEEFIEDTAIVLKLQDFPVVDIEFSPTGEWLAISDVSGTIFLLDMNLINDPYEFANQRIVLQQYGDMVYDMVFDIPPGDNLPARYLYAAGPENSILAYNLVDMGIPPVTFPFAHDGTPQLVQVSNDLGDNEVHGQYWLTSIDDDGMVVFWDVYRLLGLGPSFNSENYYELQLMNRSPLSMQISFDENQPIGNTSRNLLIAGAPDHSVRLVNLSVEAETWEYVQLRSLFGRIKDIDITLDNQYIASTSNNRVRIWDVDDVSNYENAVPWRSRFQFLVPILMIYAMMLQAAGTYIMQAYGIGSRELAIKFLMSAMFGFYFETWGGFFLSLLWPVFPKARVVNGNLEHDPDRFEYVDIIGGPGRIHVRPGNVASFMTNRMQTAVVTNMTYWLRPFERLRNIISLEEQTFTKDEIETYTRDGIKIKVKNIEVRYRIPHTDGREKWSDYRNQFIALGRSPKERRDFGKIFDAVRKDNIEEISRTYRLNAHPQAQKLKGFLNKVADLIKDDELLYINRAPNEYGNIDRKALQSAINNLYWNITVEKTLEKRVRFFVNRHNLDYFTAPNFVEKKDNDLPNGHFRVEFRDQVLKDANSVLKPVGAEVTFMDVGIFEINRKEIETARYTLWQWKTRTQADRIRSEGQAILEQARNRGRNEGERRIVEKIIEGLDKIRTILKKDIAGDPTIQKTISVSRLSTILRDYLRRIKVDSDSGKSETNQRNSGK